MDKIEAINSDEELKAAINHYLKVQEKITEYSNEVGRIHESIREYLDGSGRTIVYGDRVWSYDGTGLSVDRYELLE
ncbi:MAG: hypothetical protein SAJ12_10485 [Jaaginema sp. PMC 1079.18]|nr:hypothetical protein [Jaaginema sp. PMC 1080.18]MEC4851428.1 hypothetical protein [Jaaginema sp. PMC 1079.18]MEC4866102.1 hypothetical protein [Jaaginema sp. PMC 1078.18]